MIERLKYLYRAYKYKYVKDSNEIGFALKHIQKGDTIIDIGCHKGAYLYWFEQKVGKQGKVLVIDRDKNRVLVEGVNKEKKNTKPQSDKANPEGGIIEKEASIHISNLMLVDSATGEATKVGRKMNDDNKLVRFSKKTGEEIKS